MGNRNNGITVSNGNRIRIGGPTDAEKNYVCDNRGWGIVYLGDNMLRQHNEIGRDKNKLEKLNGMGNGHTRGNNNTIDGDVSVYAGGPGEVIEGSGNTIENALVFGNQGDGIEVSGADHTTVTNNLIGTDDTFAQGLGNLGDGLAFDSGSDTALATGNTIVSNAGNGVTVSDSDNIALQFNYVGTDIPRDAGLGNGGNGITGSYATNAGPIDDNVIINNGGAGVSLLAYNNASLSTDYVFGNGGDGINVAQTTLTSLVNSLVGTDENVTTGLGNGGNGLVFIASTITLPVTNNTIVSNQGDAVEILSCSNIALDQNDIGTLFNHASSSYGNLGNGVLIDNSDHIAVANSDIWYNGLAGVRVPTGPAWITRNSIDLNGGLGIDKAELGVTTDGAPYLFLEPGSTAIQGLFYGLPNTEYSIELFVCPIPDPSGYGEGRIWTCTITTGTDGSGQGGFVTVALPPGWYITATATGPDDNTSEFSNALRIPVPGGPGGGGGGSP
jgi:hypothetical protein